MTDIYGCNAQGWTEEEFAEQLDRKSSAARRRAGLGPRQPSDICATSMDRVSRDPQRVPFAAYPLHPVACARLIGDLAVFTVETSGPTLADSLGSAGFNARSVRPPGAVGDLALGEVVMELSVITGSQLLPGGLRTSGRRHESTSPGACQCCAMGIPGIAIQPVDEGNSESAVRFLIEWVSDGEAEARRYLADHAEPDGASLIATRGPDVIGYVSMVWESNYAGFRSRGIPLVHQIAVAGPFRQQGVATLLMDAAEQLARDRGIVSLGITVGLFDEYGPAQRLYGRRGYIPDGRGACRGQRPLSKGLQVIMDDDLIIWLTRDLVS